MISFFIPIRKNSKRIKNKNIKKIGKFKYGLTEIKVNHFKNLRDALKKEQKIEVEFIFSTDCKKIKNYLKKFSWIKIHHRSRELSTDDCLDKLIKLVPKICMGEYILWTHVTSPCFDHKCYQKFIKDFLKSKDKHNSSFSADLVGTFIMNNKYEWISHNYFKKKWPRTQDLKKHYAVNSAAFIAKKNVYVKNNDRLCSKPVPFITEKGKGFDIDDKEDLTFFKKSIYKSLFN